MNRTWMRRTLPVAVLVATAAGVTGCSDDGTASDVASRAASAVASVGAEAQSAADEAKKKLDSVKDGANAKDDVKLGAVGKDGDGRSTVAVTVSNTADDKKSFAVQVDFRDAGGNLLDTVVVTVADVAAGGTGEGTARSNRSLSGEIKADTGTALRY